MRFFLSQELMSCSFDLSSITICSGKSSLNSLDETNSLSANQIADKFFSFNRDLISVTYVSLSPLVLGQFQQLPELKTQAHLSLLRLSKGELSSFKPNHSLQMPCKIPLNPSSSISVPSSAPKRTAINSLSSKTISEYI